jgi:hypothetical protein
LHVIVQVRALTEKDTVIRTESSDRMRRDKACLAYLIGEEDDRIVRGLAVDRLETQVGVRHLVTLAANRGELSVITDVDDGDLVALKVLGHACVHHAGFVDDDELERWLCG